MFKEKLIKNYANAALTNTSGKTYTNGMLLRKMDSFIRLFEVLRVDKKDVVGIHCEDEAIALAAVLACLSYGTNFTILNAHEDILVTKVKIGFSRASMGLILSNELLSEYTLIVDPVNFQVIGKNSSYYALEEEHQIARSNLYDAIRHIKTIAESRDVTEGCLANYDVLPEHHLSVKSADIMGVAFHFGMDKGYLNASLISHASIVTGVKKALKELKYANGDRIICLEPIDLLYDLINGVLVPILKGGHVIMLSDMSPGGLFKLIKNTSAKTLYSCAPKFEKLISDLEKEITPLKWVNKWRFVYNLAMTRKFNKLLNSEIGHVVLHGKISKQSLLNSIKKKYTVLYTMTEVVSFIAQNTFYKLPEVISLKATDIKDIAINSRNDDVMGEIMVYTEDMFDRYLTISHTEKVFLKHSFKARFSSGDVGYIQNGELIIVDKAKNIFVNEHGLTIETGNIITQALRFELIKEANVVMPEPSVLKLLVEPDFVYAEEKGLSPEEIKEELGSIIRQINGRLKGYSKLNGLILFSDPEGLIRKNYKVISRHL